MSKSILLTALPPRHYFKRQARRIKVLEAEEMRRNEEERRVPIHPDCLPFPLRFGLWLEAPLMFPHPQENQESERQSANLVDLVAQLHNFHWFH